MKYCDNCEKRIEESYYYCSNCGKQLKFKYEDGSYYWVTFSQSIKSLGVKKGKLYIAECLFDEFFLTGIESGFKESLSCLKIMEKIRNV